MPMRMKPRVRLLRGELNQNLRACMHHPVHYSEMGSWLSSHRGQTCHNFLWCPVRDGMVPCAHGAP